MNTRKTIVREVDAFLAASGTAKTNFGRRVLGDPRFVDRLRAGSDITTGTADKIRAYIAENSPPHSQQPKTLE